MSSTIQKIAEYGNRRRIQGGPFELLAILLIFLVGFSAFGLGRLSALEGGVTPLTLLEPADADVEAPALSLGGMFVASRVGSVYHYPWCSGASRMAPENKMWFKSAEEAKAAGYRPAKNCKGLTEE